MKLAIVLAAVLALSGCDKLKSAIGKGDDAGSSSSSGGGVLSFLGSDFEGEITANITSKEAAGKPPQIVTFGIKKPKYRIDTSSPVPGNPALAQGGSVILDPPTKKGWLLIHQQKMAMVIDFDKLKSMPKPNFPGGSPATPSKPSAPAGPPPKIEKTGKTDTVAGYKCDVWKITTDKDHAEVCVAEGITWIDLGDLAFSAPELAVGALASEANHFPLRVISYNPQNVEQMRMETTKIEKKKIDDARFVVPPDYRVMDMSAMLGGMMGGPQGPGGGAIPSGFIPSPHKPR